MKAGSRFYVRATVLAITTGICAVAFAGATNIGVPCKPCAVLYQYCVAHGGGAGECEDQYDRCVATECPGTAALMPSDRKAVDVTVPKAMARATAVSSR